MKQLTDPAAGMNSRRLIGSQRRSRSSSVGVGTALVLGIGGIDEHEQHRSAQATAPRLSPCRGTRARGGEPHPRAPVHPFRGHPVPPARRRASPVAAPRPGEHPPCMSLHPSPRRPAQRPRRTASRVMAVNLRRDVPPPPPTRRGGSQPRDAACSWIALAAHRAARDRRQLPAAAAGHLARRPPRQRPRPARAARPRRLGVPAPARRPARRARAVRSACSASPPGIEAFHYTREVGPSGDDFTGLLALPAGLLLLGLGAVTLWRTRRTDGSLAWRYPRRALLGVAGVLVGAIVVLADRARLRHHAHRPRRRAAEPARRRRTRT